MMRPDWERITASVTVDALVPANAHCIPVVAPVYASRAIKAGGILDRRHQRVTTDQIVRGDDALVRRALCDRGAHHPSPRVVAHTRPGVAPRTRPRPPGRSCRTRTASTPPPRMPESAL